MNGPHDLGGLMGFGPVLPEVNEPIFHAEWEARALGITLACGALGHWNIDESRHARESLPWPIYLGSSYYEIWTRALEALLLRHGLISSDDLARGSADPALPHARRLAPEAVDGVLARGAPADRQLTTRPRFAEGERVATRNLQPGTHIRLPAYARGKTGTVITCHGGFVLPDSHAHGDGEAPEHLYTVCFDATELWGGTAEPGSHVMIDAWESYLDHA